MANIVKFGGGGTSKPPVAVIVVTAPTGSAVTAVCGSKSYTAVEHDGRWGIYVDALGTYTVTATRGTDSDTATVKVTQEGGVYSATLEYEMTVNITGTGLANGTTVKASVIINGTRYFNPATLAVEPGTKITLSVAGTPSPKGIIEVNNTRVVESNESKTYDITPSHGPVDISLSVIRDFAGYIKAFYPTTAAQALQIENEGLKAALHTLGVDTGEVDTM